MQLHLRVILLLRNNKIAVIIATMWDDSNPSEKSNGKESRVKEQRILLTINNYFKAFSLNSLLHFRTRRIGNRLRATLNVRYTCTAYKRKKRKERINKHGFFLLLLIESQDNAYCAGSSGCYLHDDSIRGRRKFL
ncbi:hypothetical protein PUN28_017715 [Cardiocondyla obscurior]|uniref:Uncharacterized protein n=1 Tax=Cardiocondyla obscurior TaxID=286306 RepID=A0AAW2EKB2_9HYME